MSVFIGLTTEQWAAVSAIATVVAAGVAGMAAKYASKAYAEAKGAYEHTRKTEFAQVHRPILQVRSVHLDSADPATGHVHGRLQVVNHGNTEARITESGCFFLFSESLPPRPLKAERQGWLPAGDVIGPGVGLNYDVGWRDSQSTSPTDATGEVHIWGWISYEDDEDVSRHYEFIQRRLSGELAFVPLAGTDYSREP